MDVAIKFNKKIVDFEFDCYGEMYYLFQFLYAYENFLKNFKEDIKMFSLVTSHIEREIEWNIKLKKYKEDNIKSSNMNMFDKIHTTLEQKRIIITEYLDTIKEIGKVISKIKENEEVYSIWEGIKIELFNKENIKSISIFNNFENAFISISKKIETAIC